MNNLKNVHLQGSLTDLSTKLSFILDDGSSYRVVFPDGMSVEAMAKQFIELGEVMLKEIKDGA